VPPEETKSKEKPLSSLGAREPQFVNEDRIENRKTIIENTHCKEEIQEGRKSNPPDVVNSLHARIPKVKDESETEIPVETLCIHNGDGVPKIETIRGTF
jgi:hypothetical protein